MLRYLLVLDGHEVHESSDGIAGADLALRLRPEVAVIDIGLPGVDGYEVARRIRAEAGDTMMLIALTGYGSVEDRIRTRQAGFAAHLVKPLDPGAVKHLLSAPGWPRPASESEDAAVQS